MTPKASHGSGFGYAIAASFCFGISTPLSKVFLDRVDPWMLAGLLFLGGGLGLMAIDLVWRLGGKPIRFGSAIEQRDLSWLAASILVGGVISPVLLLFGLSGTSASAAGLLLNFEGVFTVLIAWVAFGERLTWQLVGGIATITAGGLILAQTGQSELGFSWGTLAILGTCLMWGLDGNLTHHIADRHALQIAIYKSGGAGAINVLLALAIGNRLPPPIVLGQTLVVGFFGYGLTLLCFVMSLRQIGAARTGTVFALSPFVSAAIAVLFLQEQVTQHFMVAAALMAIGVALCLSRSKPLA